MPGALLWTFLLAGAFFRAIQLSKIKNGPKTALLSASNGSWAGILTSVLNLGCEQRCSDKSFLFNLINKIRSPIAPTESGAGAIFRIARV